MALAMLQRSNSFFDVGSFDAKTYFAELLRKVGEGNIIRITKNGKPVAIMQSPQKAANTEAMSALQSLKTISLEIAEKQAEYKASKVSQEEIFQFIDEGRKY